MPTSIHIAPCSTAKSIAETSLDFFFQQFSITLESILGQCPCDFWLLYACWNTAYPAHPAIVQNPRDQSHSWVCCDSSFLDHINYGIPTSLPEGADILGAVLYPIRYRKEPGPSHREIRTNKLSWATPASFVPFYNS